MNRWTKRWGRLTTAPQFRTQAGFERNRRPGSLTGGDDERSLVAPGGHEVSRGLASTGGGLEADERGAAGG